MATSVRWTIADLETLPETPGMRYEIIGGELHMSRQPHSSHQDVCGEVYFALQAWSKQTGTGRAYFAPGLVFADDDDVVPDVAWASNQIIATAIDEAGHFRVAPELVVEVLSPGAKNRQRDQETKLTLYARRAVAEYWIVDWQQRQVQVYRREDAALQLVQMLGVSDELRSPLLPGFVCQVGSVFARIT